MYALILTVALGPLPDAGRPTPPDRLILALGADDFDAREEATAALLALDWWQVGPLLRYHSDHPDAEVRFRVRRVSAVLRDRAAESFAPFPMADAAYFNVFAGEYEYGSPEHGYAAPYLARARAAVQYPYDGYRDATRLMVADWIDEGQGEAAIRLRLLRWHAVDAVYCLHRRSGWNRPDVAGTMGVTWWQRVILGCAEAR